MENMKEIVDNEDYFNYLRNELELNEDEICILRISHKEDREPIF